MLRIRNIEQCFCPSLSLSLVLTTLCSWMHKMSFNALTLFWCFMNFVVFTLNAIHACNMLVWGIDRVEGGIVLTVVTIVPIPASHTYLCFNVLALMRLTVC